MQDDRINYVVVGAFVTAMLAALVVVISLLAGRTGATDSYFTVYSNVGGLKFGTLVLYEGYQIGQVENIEPVDLGNNQLQFRVELTVEEGWKIPEDSIARALTSGLLSAVAIDIDAGKSATVLKPGAQIRGTAPSNMFAALENISAQFGDLSSNSIRPLLDNLNKYVTVLGDSMTAHLPQALADLENAVAGVQRTMTLIETDVLKPANRAHIDTMLANFAAVSSGLEETRQVLSQAVTNVNRVIEDNTGNLSEVARDLRYTLDTIARYVDDISHNTDATARNMAEFSRSIREDPALLLLGGSPQDDQAKEKSK